MTVTGKLNSTMAIGGESTGWAIQLESETTIDGHQVSSIEVNYPKTGKLEKLDGKRVTAIGTISRWQGVETGERPILVVSSIKEAKVTTHLYLRTQFHSALQVANGYWKISAAAE
jgi:hypothetical protein